jgi:hypothetical protein
MNYHGVGHTISHCSRGKIGVRKQALHLFNWLYWFNSFNWFGFYQPIQPMKQIKQIEQVP